MKARTLTRLFRSFDRPSDAACWMWVGRLTTKGYAQFFIDGARRQAHRFGDKVAMPGVPFVVEVLEIGQCEDGPQCSFGPETFRFKDPGGQGDDWMHTSEFEKA